jgi:hypothetical protein
MPDNIIRPRVSSSDIGIIFKRLCLQKWLISQVREEQRRNVFSDKRCNEIIISRLRASTDLTMDLKNIAGRKYMAKNSQSAVHLPLKIQIGLPRLSRTTTRSVDAGRRSSLWKKTDCRSLCERNSARFRAKHRFASENARYSSATEVSKRNREQTDGSMPTVNPHLLSLPRERSAMINLLHISRDALSTVHHVVIKRVNSVSRDQPIPPPYAVILSPYLPPRSRSFSLFLSFWLPLYILFPLGAISILSCLLLL